MKNYKDIEDLLERFFDGYTSNEEEARLYDFFAGKEIPEHLEKYKPVFGYFETELGKELTEPVPVRKSIRASWKMWVGIAASLLLLLILSPLVLNKPDTFNPYEGSYIVRNGERITDPDRIRPELEATIARVIQEQEEAERFLMCLTEKAEQYRRVDRQLAEQYDALLNTFKDPNTRRMVQTIMEAN